MANKKRLKQGLFVDLEELTTEEKVKNLVDAFKEKIAPQESLTLDEWADKYRVLPKETSSEYGPWKTSRFPFLKKIMFRMSKQSRARQLVVQKGAQLGFTETLINKIFYNVDQYPGPTLYVQATKDAAIEFVTQKLDPSIAACPRIADILGSREKQTAAKRIKRKQDARLNKGFPGGFVSLGGMNSKDFIRSKSIRDALLDEEDSFKANVGGQGSPIANLRKRLANFPFSKLVRVSAPAIKETSTIEPARLAGSDEHWYVPCPHCNPEAKHEDGFLFEIQWPSLKWSEELDEENLPKRIWVECPNCGGVIEEHYKTWMLDNGEWYYYNEEDNKLEIIGDVENPSHFISSLNSPLGFFSWRDAIQEFFEYKASGDKNLLQVFINQTLGETYSLAGQDVSSNHLFGRKEDYINGDTGEVVEVADGGLVLTSGVDIQADRIEVEVVAWGQGLENWSVDYNILWGPTDYLGDERGLDKNTGLPTVWTELDRYLSKKWKHARGIGLPVECTFVDSGYRSEQVNAFCKLHENRRVYPCKGQAGFGHTGYFKRPKKRSERFQNWLFWLYVDEIKDKVYQSFVVEEPGPGYCHFPNKDQYDEQHFEALTVENKAVKIVGGRKVLYWNLPQGKRNEPLDCRGYAFAARAAYPVDLKNRANPESPFWKGQIDVVAKPKKRRGARMVSRGL